MLRFQDFLFELGEANLRPFDWFLFGLIKKDGDMTYVYKFKEGDLNYSVNLIQGSMNDTYSLTFDVDGDTKIVTNHGQQFRIISTVLDILFSFVDQYDPDTIDFIGAVKGNEKEGQQQAGIRTRLYREYIKKNLPDEYKMVDKGNRTLIQKR